MDERFSRTERVLGEEKLKKLANSNVMVFGVGGVGGHCIEALVRMGIENITVVDGDTIDITNINRQLIATQSTVGRAKVEVIKERLLDINPNANIKTINKMYLPETRDEFDFDGYDYIVDAIDNVTAKLDIICRAKENGIDVISSMGTGNKLEPTMLEVSDISKTSVCPLAKVIRKELRKRAKENGIDVISSMGTGNKLEPTMLEVSDISKTSVCPLAKVIRKELRKREIKDVKVIFSKEEPKVRANPPGSVSFVPPVAGMIMASEVVKDIVDIK